MLSIAFAILYLVPQSVLIFEFCFTSNCVSSISDLIHHIMMQFNMAYFHVMECDYIDGFWLMAGFIVLFDTQLFDYSLQFIVTR
jgi:hypothetical protein